MVWDMDDYPASMKNLEKPVRKKAIEIANAMLDEGYEEGRAIPIAIEQAKKWVEHHGKDEIKEFMKNEDVTKRSDNKDNAHPELLDHDECVIPHPDGWAVQVKGGKKPSKVFKYKKDAISRAKKIAQNKGTNVIIYKNDGNVQKTYSYKD